MERPPNPSIDRRMKLTRIASTLRHGIRHPVRTRVGSLVLAIVSAMFLLGETVSAQMNAQALKDPLAPAGRLRVDFSPSFTAWDTRFGIDPSGQDVDEALGDDLTDPTGTSLFPGIEDLRRSIQAMAAGATFSPVIGAARGQVRKDVSRIDLSLELGVFDWLTVGATVPWVKNRTTVDLAFTPAPGSELGLNPSISAGEQVGLALQLLADAAANTRSWANATCQAGGPDCSAAEDLAQRVEAFVAGSNGAYFASPYFPTSGSSAAGELRRALTDLDTELSAAGLGETGVHLPFATEVVDAETFAELSNLPGGGIQGSALEDVRGLYELGDVELHATVRLLQGEVRDSGAATPRLSYLLVGGALVRLGTGFVDHPDVFLDMSTGDGQMDVEARLFGAVRAGDRLGLRAEVRYGIQQAKSLILRVAPHEVVMPPLNTRRAVRWRPGSYLAFSLSPRWHLTDQLSVSGDYRFFSKGNDHFEIIGDRVVDGVDADPLDLEHESRVTFQEAGLGLTYSTMDTWREGLTGSPLEFNLRVVRAVSGGGGRTPKITRFELGFRIFRRIWGANSPTTGG